uniref:Ig-like domain-containing protein n=1 Tax=Oncorhynchus mykiss TaxID=8022 RepID=A0A8C7UX38_ONCMY
MCFSLFSTTALPPTINEEASESIVIQEGRSVYVHCTAKGEPAPVLKWTLPAGVHVKPSQILGRRLFVFPNGTLYIKNISPEDSGRYECSVTNAVGAARRVLYLKARQEVPKPHINEQGGRSSMKVLAVSYQTTLLDCRAEGKPEPRVSWAAPYGLSLPTPYLGGRFQVHKNGSLELRGVRKTDEGQYVCLAKNHLGEASLDIQCNVENMHHWLDTCLIWTTGKRPMHLHHFG